MKRKRMFQVFASLLAVTVLLISSGCTPKMNRYQTVFMDLFDTVTTVTGYAPDEKTFQQEAGKFHDGMLHYHQLYDIYHTYEGMVNLRTLNERAGETVEVGSEIMDLLLFARETLGSVLSVWHRYREAGIEDPLNARLPDGKELQNAREHTGFDKLVLDAEKHTVQFLDSSLQLDVGALAKGYATQRVGETMKTGYLISVGGNVYATGPKPDGTAWTVGIQDPDGKEAFLDRLNIRSGSVVTSGDYQRFYTVDGKNYHHIINPDTLYPSNMWRAVTVITPDSGLADALSTTLFLMSREEGEALLGKYGAEAMWMAQDGTITCSKGYTAYRQAK